jgi:hypothetical protein
VQNDYKRISMAKQGKSTTALMMRDRGKEYDKAMDISSEYSCIIGDAIGFVIGALVFLPPNTLLY